jgi:hypothetical protein
MDAPLALDRSDGPLAVRRLVVWRRLEPGDARTPGTELAPESPHLEARVVEVGIAESLREELARLQRARDEVTTIGGGWSTRYEPAGVLLASGGGLSVGVGLEYLPAGLWPFALSLAGLGAAVGVFTRTRKDRRAREAERRWRDAPERAELEALEARLRPAWRRFVDELREEGFRTEVRIGEAHEAERLQSLDEARLAHPDTWAPDAAPEEVRYGWVFADGRVVEQVAVLEGDPT